MGRFMSETSPITVRGKDIKNKNDNVINNNKVVK